MEEESDDDDYAPIRIEESDEISDNIDLRGSTVEERELLASIKDLTHEINFSQKVALMNLNSFQQSQCN